jgi:hypothetical protein
VSMTTFKVPDFASKGGNLLSKFIYLTNSRFLLKSRGPFPTFSQADISDSRAAPTDRSPKDFEDTITKTTEALSCHLTAFVSLVLFGSSYPCHRRHARLDLFPIEMRWEGPVPALR